MKHIINKQDIVPVYIDLENGFIIYQDINDKSFFFEEFNDKKNKGCIGFLN